MDEQTTIDPSSLPVTSAINLSTLLPVLGLVAGCVTYSYLRRTIFPVLPFVENPDWEQNEPNAEGWRHSSFDWAPAPRFARGSEDSEFERLWAPGNELSSLQRARLGLSETAETSGTARETSSASAATGASGANGTNCSAQPASSQRPAINPRQPRRSASTISNNGSVQSSASSQQEPVHLIDWSLNGFGL